MVNEAVADPRFCHSRSFGLGDDRRCNPFSFRVKKWRKFWDFLRFDPAQITSTDQIVGLQCTVGNPVGELDKARFVNLLIDVNLPGFVGSLLFAHGYDSLNTDLNKSL